MYNVKESGKRLKELREKCGQTQNEVAEKMNMSLDTVRKNEQGVRGLSVDSVDLYAQYYNTSIDYIINGNNSDDNISMVLSRLEELSVEKKNLVIKILDGIIEKV